MGEKRISTKEALQLLAIGGIIIGSLIVPGLGKAVFSVTKAWKRYKYKDVGHLIRRFQSQGVITIVDKDGQLAVEITEKGKKKLLNYQFEEMSLKKKRDGFLYLLTFDIPDQLKVARELFRSKLKELGFIQVQKSVFVSPFRCKDEVQYIAEFIGISQYIELYKVHKVELGSKYIFKKKYN